jgi:hypothetical protein
MQQASRRQWRLFYLGLLLVAASSAALAQTAPTLITISECRWSDTGWGPFNDENLAGRFTTQAFTLPRLARVQDYFLRQCDASTPPRYSRHSSALHIDFPAGTAEFNG